MCIDAVLAAARDLTRAGRWATAQELLAAVAPADAADAARLGLQRAEVEADRSFWMQDDPDAGLLASAAPARAKDPWAVAFLELRVDYAAQLRSRVAGGRPSVDGLRARAADLVVGAPGATQRSSALFYRGLIEDVLAEDAAAAGRCYADALGDADDYTRSYLLRHMGGHRQAAGDAAGAEELWRESMTLRQRVGFVPGTLAQLALLQDSLPVADVVTRWARELRVPWL